MDTGESISNRHTTKMLGDPNIPVLPTKTQEALILSILKKASNAPFHYAVHSSHRRDSAMTALEPWRVYLLQEAASRALLNHLQSERIDSGKIAQMLAVCHALALVTWCPDPPVSDSDLLYDPTLINMEHIAATAAYCQNVLLLATAEGFKSYWSSGGVLRTPEMFKHLGIAENQLLLGALFIFPGEKPENSEEVAGKFRPVRSDSSAWMRDVKL